MNKIKFRIVDGRKGMNREFSNGQRVMIESTYFGIEDYELETEELLNVGDFIEWESYNTRIEKRIYSVKNKNFTYFCEAIWTGRYQ